MTDDELLLWPDAPTDQRPKSLFVDSMVFEDTKGALKEKGWIVYDVRLLANKSDGDRAEALKCCLEGIRVGTIAADKDKLRWLELEAKVYGLLTGKDKIKDTVPKIDGDVLENLLDFTKATKTKKRGA